MRRGNHRAAVAARSVADRLFLNWAIEQLEPRTLFSLPAWLAPNSHATWDVSTHTLTVTGNATITADPGSDAPNIVETSSADRLTIAPLISDVDIHVGGIALSGGSKLIVASVGGDRSNSNHNVLVVGNVSSAAAPTFTISTSSKLDLQDNDLIIHDGDLASVQALAQEGRNAPDGPGNGTDGTWSGDGLTSSVAQDLDDPESTDYVGLEETALAVVLNSDAGVAGIQYSSWSVGSATEPLRPDGNDVIVKYTYYGDEALEGYVGTDSVKAVQGSYTGTDTLVSQGYPNDDWIFGDFDGSGADDRDDVASVQAFYGLGFDDDHSNFTLGATPAEGNTGIILNWSASTGVSSYEVLRDDLSDSTIATLSGDSGVSGTSFIDATAVKGVPYNYRVVALVDGDPSSDVYSNFVTAELSTAPASIPWLSPTSAATWNPATGTLTVTGNATIIADPLTNGAADEPKIVETSSAARLTIAPLISDQDIHIGGLTLSNGAQLIMSSVGDFRTNSNHNVLVVGDADATTAPTFSISSNSKLDLEDNDLIIHDGNLAAAQADLAEGRNVAAGGEFNGTWTGNGLTSSVAATDDDNDNAGSEEYLLAAGDNSEMLFQLSSWTVGSAVEPLRSDGNDVMVKFTYNGDFNLDGKVDGQDAAVLGNNFDSNHADGNNGYDFVGGDTNGDTYVDTTDAAVLGNYFGNGIGEDDATFTLQATPTSDGSGLHLHWSGSPDATGYEVDRIDSGTGEFVTLSGGPDVTGTSFTDSSVSAGSTYSYRVFAIVDGTPSTTAYSTFVTAQLPGVISVTPPAGVVVDDVGSPTAISFGFNDTDNIYYTFGSTSATHIASIDWGDGTGGSADVTSGTIVEPDGYGNQGSVSGTHTYTSSGSYNVSVTIQNSDGSSATSTAQVSVVSLPSGWTDTDIGAPGLPGAASFEGTSWTVEGGGSDIWGTSDQFNFADQSVSGDATLVARVDSQADTDDWAKAGLMFRDGSSADAAFADLMVSPAEGINFQYRSTAGGSAQGIQALPASVPAWLMLQRRGDQFIAYYSSNGTTWLPVDESTISMGATALAGLAVTSHDDDTLGSATFSHVAVLLPSQTSTMAVTPSTSSIGVTIGAAHSYQWSFTDTDLSLGHTATIDWGDGTSTTLGSIAEPTSATTDGEIFATHTYSSAGTFTASITLRDKDDASTTASATVNAHTQFQSPTSLTASAVSPTEIDLSWEAAAGATGYIIEMDDGDGLGLEPFDSVSGSATSYQAASLDIATSYTFCVVAVFADGESTSSNTASASTPDPVPNNLQAQVASTNEIDLSWSGSYTGEEGFEVLEQQNDGTWNQVDEVAAGTYTDAITGLAEGTTQSFEVEAAYGADDSGASSIAMGTTNLAAPTGASATAIHPGEANVIWTDNSSSENGFDLSYYVDGPSGSPTTITVPPNGADGQTGYTLTGLASGTKYDVSITAYKGTIQSAAVTASFTTPAAPSNQGTDIGSVTPDVSSAAVQSFGNEPEGTYKIVWTSGVLNFLSAEPGLYGINSGSHGYIVQYQSGTSTVTQGFGGTGTFDTSGHATASLQAASPSLTFTTTGGPIGMYLYDDPYYDNQGPGGTFKLIKLPDPLPTVSIQTVADPGLLIQPAGDAVSSAFTISRSMPYEAYSSALSVSLNPWLGTALKGDGKDYTLYEQPTGYIFPAGTPPEDQIQADVPTPPAPTEMSAGSVDIPANYSGVTVMVQLLSTAKYNRSGTIYGLLKAGATYLLADAMSGSSTTAAGSTYTENGPDVDDIGWIESTPGETSLNIVANPAPPTSFAVNNGNPNAQTLSAWELQKQYRNVLAASLAVTFDSQTGKVIGNQASAAKSTGYTPLPLGSFMPGQGHLKMITVVKPDGKGIIFKALAKFRVAAWENLGFAIGHLHRLAWAWSEVSIEIDAGNPNADVKFAGSFVPSQTYYINNTQVGGYSMPTNVAGVNSFLRSPYNTLGAGDPLL